jgi:hypothetical protein
MRKVVSALSRMILVFGVLVALTPCGICNASTQAGMPQMKSCEMGPMSGMKCCQSSKSKSQSPLCKTMNQSSLAQAVHGSDLAAVPAVSFVSADVFFSAKTFVSPAFSGSFASPPRGLLALRI